MTYNLGAELTALSAPDIGVSGWFDSVKDAVVKYTGTGITNQFIKDQGLEPYVNVAAKAVATYYGGPAAGLAAGAIQPYLSNIGTKDKKKEAEAKQKLQQVQATPAVDVAHDAIQKTATTYHVAQIMNDAKAGKPGAQQALNNLRQAAARGDADAQQAVRLMAVIEREQRRNPVVGGWQDSIGANMTNILGAELTALSSPGYGFRSWYRPFYGYGYPGVYLGAASDPSQRTGLTAELAPIVAPATGGVTVEKRLDDKQVLHVKICVDGKCYETSMNLAPAIAMVMQKLASWHDGMHAPKPPPETVVSTVETAVGMAEDAIVGALIARHVDTICGNFLGDIAGAVAGAVTGVASGVAATFKKLKGPIGAAAGIAAATAAAAIPGVGPIAAPIAGKLANDLVQSAAGDDKATKVVQQAQAQAKTDPVTALALKEATKAVATSTAAHHVQETAKKAAQGDPAAKQQIVQVATDAEKGDPAAKAVADIVANAMKSEWGAKLWEKATGRGPGVISGLEIIQHTNPMLALRLYLLNDGVDFMRTVREQIMVPSAGDPNQFVFAPSTVTNVKTWWETKTVPFLRRLGDWYASKDELHFPGWLQYFTNLRTEAQQLGLFVPPMNQVLASAMSSTKTAGWVNVVGGDWVDIVGGADWVDIVGAALEDVRDIARTHASTKRGKAAGVIQYADGTMHGRGFGSLERAMEWLKHATRNRTVFIYAAACDKAPDGSAQIHDEEIGEATPRAVTPNAPVAMVG